MSASPNISQVASLIGDPSRAAILTNLLGGRALPAGELARAARVTPQTASSHLSKLLEGGLLVTENYGRHRYYRLASPDVGHALEALATIAPTPVIKSLRESDEAKAIRLARTCYDHFAGTLGVALTSRFVELEYVQPLDRAFEVTHHGERVFSTLGLDIDALRRGKRAFTRQCLDWSERRVHLAGAVGAAITHRFFDLGWTTRVPGGRAVVVTPLGASALEDRFGIAWPLTSTHV